MKTDDFLLLQPYQRGWIVTYKGEHIGSIKKLKSGWKIDTTYGGRYHDIAARAAELLDTYKP